MTDPIAERERVLADFLAAEKEQLAACCHALARAFARGGSLVAYGTGAAATDAAHVAVEFMHPVIVGKRALPAFAPPNDVFGTMRAGDIALGIAHAPDPAVDAFLERARGRGLTTVSFGTAPADFVFTVPSGDPHVVQEVQETTYHVLWELVHTFFEHPGLLDDACITCGDIAVTARVVDVAGNTATIEKDGLREAVAVELVDVTVGDTVLCHAGVVLEKVL